MLANFTARAAEADAARAAGAARAERSEGPRGLARFVLAHRLELGIAVLGAAVTAAVAASPALQFAVTEPTMHVGLETMAGLASALVGYLLYGRFRSSGRLDDLLLVCTLGCLAISNLAFSALPAALSGGESTPFGSWATIPAYLVGGAAFVGAAFVRERRIGRDTAHAVMTLFLAALFVIGVVAAVLGSSLPAGAEPVAGEASGAPELAGHPFVLGVQLLGVVLFSAAAVEFSRRATRNADELLRWIAVAAILGVFVRFNYFLYPTLYAQIVSIGDLFRLTSHLVLLVGAVREIERHWHRMADAAVLEERERIARDIHDGVAQELAFITRRVRPAAGAPDDATLAQIRAASQRALQDSRLAIAALSRPHDEPLSVSLEKAAKAVAARSEIDLRLDLEEGVQVPPAAREALVRIVCEAVTNSARHADTDSVRVELRNGDGVQLRVVDEGIGFRPDEVRPRLDGGFGLISMRERARALGADFDLRSKPGSGTRVEVRLP